MILHPRVKLWVLLLMRLPIKISAVWAIGGWLVFQIAMLFGSGDHSTAWPVTAALSRARRSASRLRGWSDSRRISTMPGNTKDQ